MRQTDFHHEAFFYGDLDEFLVGTVPFLREGLEAGQPALVAVAGSRAEALKAELAGERAAVRFLDMEELGCNPARIIPAWQRFVHDHGGEGRPVRGIGEPVWPGRSEDEIDECQRHESLLNHAFWDGPAWRLLCPYDSAALADEVLEAAQASHSVVSGVSSNADETAAGAVDPDAVSPFAGVLAAQAEDAAAFPFDRATLHDARTLVGAEAERLGLASDRVFDLVAAVGELTANSVLHGGGGGVLSYWQEEGALVVEVVDDGLIEEPLTGRVRPELSQLGGRGIWMVNHLCDLVQVRSGTAGTTVRVRMALARA